MLGNIFYRLDPLLICLVLIGVLLVAEELGFRVKGRTGPGSDNIEKADIALILGAVLTLLALLLGFTYAMSQGRFETRRQLVIEQANAIGTTYLRAKALPEPRSSEIQELLRQYVALRVEVARSMDDSPEKIRDWGNRTKELHDLLWSHAAALAREKPNPVTSIFLQTLNEMIDLYSKRLGAFRNRVPFSIYLVLFIVSIIALWLVGYYFGRRQRGRILTVVVVLLMVSVMWLIMDLDQPVRGAIKTNQQALFDLHQDLSQESKDATKRSF
jgi:hypothetical protein